MDVVGDRFDRSADHDQIGAIGAGRDVERGSGDCARFNGASQGSCTPPYADNHVGKFSFAQGQADRSTDQTDADDCDLVPTLHSCAVTLRERECCSFTIFVAALAVGG